MANKFEIKGCVIVMFTGEKVKVENSIWIEANGKSGKIKRVIAEDYILVDFDDDKINKASKEVGGFTFEFKNLKSLNK